MLHQPHQPRLRTGNTSQREEPSTNVEKEQSTVSKKTNLNPRGLKCHRCGSSRHLWRDCPQRRPPDETPGRVSTSSVVTQEESEAST